MTKKDEYLKEIERITPLLLEVKKREDEFFARHDVDNSHGEGGIANPAHRAWVKAVEKEYFLVGKEVRVMLDTPIARKAFILGFHAGKICQ